MATLAAITLTTPLMLWGMAGVSLPLLAHLLNRRVRRRVIFPSIKLLQQAAASQSKLFRLRKWILLALRCLAIVLLAWAFARPVWTQAQAAGSAAEGEAVVIVLDVSASSSQRSDGVSVVSRMAASAEKILGELEAGRDDANLVYAAAIPRAAYPKPIANLDALRRELRDLKPTQERADLPAAVAMAAAMLEEHKGQKQIVVLSDMQKSNWAEDVTGVLVSSPDLHLSVVPVGSASASNTGILRPSVFPARPLVGRPAQVSASVVNFADHAREVQVTAQHNGQSIGKQTLSLDSFGRQEAVFNVIFADLGPQQLTLAVTGDDLEVDDKSYLSLEVAERINVLLIGDDDPSQPTGGSYFIQRALAPEGDERDTLHVTHTRSGAVSLDSLTSAEAVVIGEVAEFSQRAAQALHDYLRRGGGVLMLLGSAAAAQNAAALQKLADKTSGVPFQPLQVLESGPQHPAWYITEGAWESRPLRSFDEVSRLALGEIPFTRVQSAGELHRAATVLLRYDDSTPALATMPYERGTLMFANFSAAPSAGSLAKHGSFVALMHGMIDAVRPQHDGQNQLVVGDSFLLDNDSRVTVTQPDGSPFVLNRPTERAGFYTLLRDGKPLLYVAANIDERESDLRREEPDSIGKKTDGGAQTQVTVAQEGGSGNASRGEPIWWWFVLGAAAAIGLELLLLSLWKR